MRSIRPGAGRPSSMYSVPPVRSTRFRLWLAPKVWLQGSQSSSTGFSWSRKRQGLRDHLLVGAQHAMGVDHHLGLAGRARGQQVFGVRVGCDRRERLHHRRRLGALRQRREGECTGLRIGAAAEDRPRRQLQAGECGRVAGGIRRRRPVPDRARAGWRGCARSRPAQGGSSRSRRCTPRARCACRRAAAAGGRSSCPTARRSACRRPAAGRAAPVRRGRRVRAVRASSGASSRRSRSGSATASASGVCTRPLFEPFADAARVRLQRLAASAARTTPPPRSVSSARRGASIRGSSKKSCVIRTAIHPCMSEPANANRRSRRRHPGMPGLTYSCVWR